MAAQPGLVIPRSPGLGTIKTSGTSGLGVLPDAFIILGFLWESSTAQPCG